MVNIRAGYSKEARKRLEKIARTGNVDIYDEEYLGYFSQLIDTSDFVDNLSRELSDLLIPKAVKQFRDKSLYPRTKYSYINRSNHYDLVSKIDVNIKQPNNLAKKIKIKQKINPNYVVKDIGRIRIAVKDETTAYQLLNSIQEGALKPFMRKNGYVLEEIDDYIENPKSNEYKALHLSIAEGRGSNKVCEIQIIPKTVYEKFDTLHKQYKAEQEDVLNN